jgi:hypothetical protein
MHGLLWKCLVGLEVKFIESLICLTVIGCSWFPGHRHFASIIINHPQKAMIGKFALMILIVADGILIYKKF